MTKDAVEEFNDHKDELMSHLSEFPHAYVGKEYPADMLVSLVWTDDCRSWYKAGSVEGKVVAIWPGSGLHYLETLASPRYEDYIWKYEDKNRFAYLGNGFSSAEKRGGDLSWYIKDKDDSSIDPCVKRKSLETDHKQVPDADYLPDLDYIPGNSAHL